MEGLTTPYQMANPYQTALNDALDALAEERRRRKEQVRILRNRLRMSKAANHQKSTQINNLHRLTGKWIPHGYREISSGLTLSIGGHGINIKAW